MRRWVRGLIIGSTVLCALSAVGLVADALTDEWVAITFESTTLPDRRPDGSPWHMSAGSQAGSVAGVTFAYLLGAPPMLGSLLGSTLDSPSEALAPAPYVVVRAGTDEYAIPPRGRGYSLKWGRSIAFPVGKYEPDADVVVQVMDAVDDAVLGQAELTVGELIGGAVLLTDVGAARTLAWSTQPIEEREPQDFEWEVEGRTPSTPPSFDVWNGDRVVIEAEGSVCPSPSASRCSGPEGVDEYRIYNLRGGGAMRHVALVAVAADGVHLVGRSGEFTARYAGSVALMVNDRDAANNTGSFRARVRVYPPGSLEGGEE